MNARAAIGNPQGIGVLGIRGADATGITDPKAWSAVDASPAGGPYSTAHVRAMTVARSSATRCAMASRRDILPDNVAGDFFVDASCIDCDACRWMAPETFDRVGEHSRVHRQPVTETEVEHALQALIACPTASIGTHSHHDVATASRAFPILVDEDVDHCGFHSEASFGAASYLIRRPPERGGNVLVDSPRFSRPLVKRLEELGGIGLLFLTHIDDVAEHERFHAHFGCPRVLHAADVEESTRSVERPIDGLDPVRLDADLVAIPVPGHTRGSMCLIHRDRYLFSGDHVAWSESRSRVHAFRDACWYDWHEQTRSMERLAEFTFEWILPGHGRRCRFDAPEMKQRMRDCVEWMKKDP